MSEWGTAMRIDHAATFLAAICALTPTSAYAANQGSLGSTSTGSVIITASVPTRVQITGLSDVNLTNSDPSIAASYAQDVCVWSNTSTRGYNITATGSGTGNAFTLANAALNVPYSVEWNATAGSSSGTALTTGTAKTGLTSTATTSTCSAGPAKSASLIVKMAANDLQSMASGVSYTGTLTLVVAPE